MKIRELQESFKHYTVKHKRTGKTYKVTAMHDKSAIDKAKAQHGGTASRYTGTSTDDFEIVEAVGEKDQYELSLRDKKNPNQTMTFQKGLTLDQANDKVYKLVKGIRQWGNDPSKLAFDNEKVDPKRIILIKNGKQIPHQFEEDFSKKSGNPLNAHGLKAYKHTQGGKDYYISVQHGKVTGEFDSLQDLKIHQTSIINGDIDSYIDNKNLGHPDGVSSMDEAAESLTEEQFDEAAGEKDACYHKVKSRYKVWPSAYASGALVKCRKVGAANWGNSKKK